MLGGQLTFHFPLLEDKGQNHSEMITQSVQNTTTDTYLKSIDILYWN